MAWLACYEFAREIPWGLPRGEHGSMANALRALIITRDDPGDFGAIAAANALNDVYAMGGVPLLALSVTAFPEELPTEVLGEILGLKTNAVEVALSGMTTSWPATRSGRRKPLP